MRQHTEARSRRLITRRSQVQILPPLLGKALQCGAFSGVRAPAAFALLPKLLPSPTCGGRPERVEDPNKPRNGHFEQPGSTRASARPALRGTASRRRSPTPMSSRPSVRTLSVLLVGALVVAAVLLAEGLRSRGRPAPATSGVKAEPIPGPEAGDKISASEQWFYEQRAYPAAHTPRGALAHAERQAMALRMAPEPGAPTASLNWTEVGPKPIATIGQVALSVAGGSMPHTGRVSAIASDPSNPDVV